jgi:hypothetical protein
MEAPNSELDKREKQPVDINQPGVLITGIGACGTIVKAHTASFALSIIVRGYLAAISHTLIVHAPQLSLSHGALDLFGFCPEALTHPCALRPISAGFFAR